MSQNPFPTSGETGQNQPESHPHDPYAGEPSNQYSYSNPESGAQGQPGVNEHPNAGAQSGFDSQPAGAYPGAAGAGQNPAGAANIAGPGQNWTDAAPPGIKGVSTEALTGEPMSESDAKLWAMLSQLSVVAGHFTGYLGWLGPLIIFLVFKDRNRLVRFNAAEALNGAITVLVASVALTVVTGIITVVTFGIGSFTLLLAALPQLVQVVCAIIAAVKINNREWWNYPVNLRLFS